MFEIEQLPFGFGKNGHALFGKEVVRAFCLLHATYLMLAGPEQQSFPYRRWPSVAPLLAYWHKR